MMEFYLHHSRLLQFSFFMKKGELVISSNQLSSQNVSFGCYTVKLFLLIFLVRISISDNLKSNYRVSHIEVIIWNSDDLNFWISSWLLPVAN